MSGEIKPKKVFNGKSFGVFILLVLIGISSWLLWQYNSGKKLAEELTKKAEQSVMESSNQVGRDSKDLNASSDSNAGAEVAPPKPSENLKPSEMATPAPINSTAQAGAPQGESSNPSASSPPEKETVKVSYKELVASTYSNTLQTMENVKTNTLALQDHKMTLASYRASIKQARANFESYEKFLQTNPPTDPKLRTPYQEFLSGVKIARDSMDVVLNGISSLNPSSLYAARDMGKTARDKVVQAYKNF